MLLPRVGRTRICASGAGNSSRSLAYPPTNSERQSLKRYNAPILYDMGAHMKTTVDLTDSLLRSAKRLAQENQTTLRALIEDGLRRVLKEQQTTVKVPFKLNDARVHGKALPHSGPADWRAAEDNYVVERVLEKSAAGKRALDK